MTRIAIEKKIALFGLAVCLSLLPGCSHKDDIPEPDVYVAGFYSRANVNIPCVWKNGVRTDLEAAEGRAGSVFVSGDDVWVAGFQGDLGQGHTTPGYWENGAWRELGVDWDAAWGGATSILVSAGDVYVAGYLKKSTSAVYIPCFWKNGVRSDLDLQADWSPDSGIGGSLLLSGGDIYVAGAVWYSGCFQPCPVACYWRNGVRTDLDGTPSHGSEIVISAGNVYVAGDHNSLPCYWQNGVRTDLSIRSGYTFSSAQAIRVFFGAALVAGTIADIKGNDVPCLWSNGDRNELDVIDAALGGTASSLFVSGSDVYVAGRCETAAATVPCFWKNSVRTDLSLPDVASGGFPGSIFVSGE